jgi:hypothetical protein
MIIALCIIVWLLCGWVSCFAATRENTYIDIKEYVGTTILMFILGPISCVITLIILIKNTDFLAKFLCKILFIKWEDDK